MNERTKDYVKRLQSISALGLEEAKLNSQIAEFAKNKDEKGLKAAKYKLRVTERKLGAERKAAYKVRASIDQYLTFVVADKVRSEMCAIEAHYLLGEIVDKGIQNIDSKEELPSLMAFDMEELSKGNISNGSENPFPVYYYRSNDHFAGKGEVVTLQNSYNPPEWDDPYSIYKKQLLGPVSEEMVAELSKNADIALVTIDTGVLEDTDGDGKPGPGGRRFPDGLENHRQLIIKDKNGIWINMNHNLEMRNIPVDFNYVYEIRYVKRGGH